MVTKPSVGPNITIKTPRDPNTLSNYHNFVTRNTSATFDIDFEKKVLKGDVILTLESLTEKETKEITLDTSFLDITDVKVNGEKVEWAVKDRIEPYGSPLKIELKEGIEKGKTIDIAVCFPLSSVWPPHETF
jgi:leukotriene-A4 hydrolase